MNILHICNDFSGSQVHARLVEALDALGISQIVYSPVRSKDLINRNIFNSRSTSFLYLYNIKPYYRYLYHYKACRLFQDLVANIDVDSIELSHAGTLFSDGFIAYKLYKKYGVPYIVAVRSTDVDIFLKYMPHTWKNGREILLNAASIVFVSPSLKNKFLASKVIKPILDKIENKFISQPNGIDDYWLRNIHYETNTIASNIMYVGKFIHRKNVPLLQQAVLHLKTEFPDIHLTLVGGEGEDHKTVLSMVHEHPSVFEYVGKITDKEVLSALYRQNSIFAMISKKETFGLVYLEALSQGLVVLYKRGEGADGLLLDESGVGIDNCSISEITQKLAQLIRRRPEYTNRNFDFTKYDWNIIASNYLKLYSEFCR